MSTFSKIYMGKILENYGSLLLLLVGITLGSIVGLWLPSWVDYLKPLGDIFLNLLFVSIIPLLFFAITSTVANIEGRSEEHTSELQSRENLVCRLLLEKKKNILCNF